MAGRIPGSGMRVLSTMVRSANKAGKTEKTSETSKTDSPSFAGHTISVSTPSTELRNILERVGDQGLHNGENNKPLSEYKVSISAQKEQSGSMANVGASESVLTSMGISKESLGALQNSIRTAFAEGAQMADVTVTTVAVGADPSVNSSVSSLLRFMKNAE